MQQAASLPHLQAKSVCSVPRVISPDRQRLAGCSRCPSGHGSYEQGSSRCEPCLSSGEPESQRCKFLIHNRDFDADVVPAVWSYEYKCPAGWTCLCKRGRSTDGQSCSTGSSGSVGAVIVACRDEACGGGGCPSGSHYLAIQGHGTGVKQVLLESLPSGVYIVSFTARTGPTAMAKRPYPFILKMQILL